MYTIYFYSRSVKKDFDLLLSTLSEDIQQKALIRLTTNPYLNDPNKPLHGNVEKKGPYWCYEISGAGRILYSIIEEGKRVLIIFAGDQNKEILYLRKYSRKTNK